MICVLQSYATDRGIEEDARVEVCIAPLGERSLLLEVFLDASEVLRVKSAVSHLISGPKVVL